MPYSTGDNKFGVCKWIVDPIAGLGTHTTITAAIASASSGDTIFIKNGTYTENFTLKAGVDLVTFSDQGDTPQVTINGTVTMSAAGTCSISGLRLQTNSAFSLVVSGANACILNVSDCDFNCTNNTGISLTNSNAASAIYLYECYGNLTTTGIAFWASSSAAYFEISYCRFANPGASTTANTNSAGTLATYYSYFFNPISTSGTNSRNSTECKISTGIQNVTALTINAASSSSHDLYDGGTSPAVTISASGVDSIANATVTSSNANAISGSGVLSVGNIAFNGSSSHIQSTITLGFHVTTNFTRMVRQVFDASGTYTPTTGMKYCDVEVIGGGGGGGAISASGASGTGAAGGGGGGGYSKKVFSAATIGTSQTVTVGAAGTAGTAAGNGGVGGTTVLGALLSATGGAGGIGTNSQAGGTTAAGGAGGVGASGDVNCTGTPGGAGLSANGAGGFPSAMGGNGGSTVFGGGGQGAVNLNNSGGTTGGTGTSYGGGGGGGASASGSGAANGGAGFHGAIFVTEYI